MSVRQKIPPAVWFGSFGHILVRFRLSSYESGQPCLMAYYSNGESEELTLEVPNFDLRAFDADYAFSRMHMVFRCAGRASLLAGCDIVHLSSSAFCFASTGETALQIAWMLTPAAWPRIRQETLDDV